LIPWVALSISVLPIKVVDPDIPQPPTGLLAALSLGAVIGLGCLTAIMVLFSILVIWAIKKKITHKDNA
jgi:hypothetical protein